MAEDLRVSLIQSPIVWEDRTANLQVYARRLQRLAGRTDVAILPETFTTGFSMQVEALADTPQGPTMGAVRSWASRFGMAVAGSYIATVGGWFYNRAFFVTPEGETWYYDKRHLFRMAGEDKHFSAGREQVVASYKGWRIGLQVCYDLRFPVWSRNVANAYDLLIYVANWPEARIQAWKSLLPARAIENIAYVAGVNRTGVDGKGFAYPGCSVLFGPRGDKLADAGRRACASPTVGLKKDALTAFRTKFPAAKDADTFSIDL